MLQHVGLKTAMLTYFQQMLCTHGVGRPAINRMHAELIVKFLHCHKVAVKTAKERNYATKSGTSILQMLCNVQSMQLARKN